MSQGTLKFSSFPHKIFKLNTYMFERHFLLNGVQVFIWMCVCVCVSERKREHFLFTHIQTSVYVCAQLFSTFLPFGGKIRKLSFLTHSGSVLQLNCNIQSTKKGRPDKRKSGGWGKRHCQVGLNLLHCRAQLECSWQQIHRSFIGRGGIRSRSSSSGSRSRL